MIRFYPEIYSFISRDTQREAVLFYIQKYTVRCYTVMQRYRGDTEEIQRRYRGDAEEIHIWQK
jgi:hypothetical protein